MDPTIEELRRQVADHRPLTVTIVFDPLNEWVGVTAGLTDRHLVRAILASALQVWCEAAQRMDEEAARRN